MSHAEVQPAKKRRVRRRARQRKACALDVTLWSEVLAGDDPWMRMLFPVNSLRSRSASTLRR